MADVIRFPDGGPETVKQDELAELERAMFIKVVADGDFASLNSAIHDRVQRGAQIEPGPRGYHRNIGVIKRGD